MPTNTTDLVRLVDISICPTDLEHPNGDIYDADKLTAAIAKFVAAKHPVAEISVQVGHRQGESWATVDGHADLGADLVVAFFDRHGSDADLFRDTEPDLLDYEIAGYRCRMEPRHALAWNAGRLSCDALEGAQILVDGTWTCLWNAIDRDGIDTPLYDDLVGMPANRID